MKKEKTIRTYQRRTKSGKVVTVKQHTAKYDAAEELRKALSKKGAGEEFEGRKGKQAAQLEVAKKSDNENPFDFTADDFKAWYHWDQVDDPKNKAALKVEKALKKQMGTKAYSKYFDEVTDSYSARGHNKAFKNLEAEHTKSQKKQDAEISISEKDIARGAKESKKVGARYDKAIKRYMDKMPKSMTIDEAIKYHEKNMPTYNEFGDDTAFTERDKKMLRDYLSGKRNINVESHLSQLKERIGAKSKEGGSSKESSTKTKDTKEKAGEDSSLKVGGSVQMGNALNNGKGNKETFKVLAVQKTNKQDRDSGNTEAAWVQRKDGSVTLALKDSERGWMYDDTWSDFTSRKHPYAKSLETAGYSFKKASGNGGDYWEVSKKGSSTEGNKDASTKTPKSSEGEVSPMDAKRARKNRENLKTLGYKEYHFADPLRGTSSFYLKKGKELYVYHGNPEGVVFGKATDKDKQHFEKALSEYKAEKSSTSKVTKSPGMPSRVSSAEGIVNSGGKPTFKSYESYKAAIRSKNNDSMSKRAIKNFEKEMDAKYGKNRW